MPFINLCAKNVAVYALNEQNYAKIRWGVNSGKKTLWFLMHKNPLYTNTSNTVNTDYQGRVPLLNRVGKTFPTRALGIRQLQLTYLLWMPMCN